MTVVRRAWGYQAEQQKKKKKRKKKEKKNKHYPVKKDTYIFKRCNICMYWIIAILVLF